MKQLLLIAVAGVFLFSCKKEEKKPEGFSSQKVNYYDGKTWSSVKLNKDGTPDQLTLTLDKDVLASVPGAGEHGHHESTVMIPLHSKAIETTPFKFIMMNWNPEGHEPATIYDLPHFDMHFYMATPAQVSGFVDPAKLNAHPSLDYLPAMHVPGAPVPAMGKHWVDITSPEFNGQTFTETFIYGTYDSKVVFYEPMITLDFLNTTNSFQRPLPQPAKFSATGYYPTIMQVTKTNGQVNITLSGFVLRQAS